MEIAAFVSPLLETNAYLVADGGEAMVVDAPYGAADWAIQEADRRGSRIIAIVLTHAHWDHMVDAAKLKGASKAVLTVHAEDSPLAEHPVTLGMSLPFEIPPARAERLLAEGDEMAAGGTRFEVLHTPGHSPGSICLHVPLRQVVFTGDTLFDGSCGRTDFPGGSEDEMRKSLNRLAALPPGTGVYSGHGPATTVARQTWARDF